MNSDLTDVARPPCRAVAAGSTLRCSRRRPRRRSYRVPHCRRPRGQAAAVAAAAAESARAADEAARGDEIATALLEAHALWVWHGAMLRRA